MEVGKLYTVEASEQGAEIQLRDPRTRKALDVFIRVKGIDSADFRKCRKARQQAELEAMAEKRELDTEALDLQMLVDLTIGWRGLLDEGKEYEFSPERCRKLYEQSPAIRDQVDRFIADRRNFTNG